jgi:hypothetical protein
MRSEILLVGAPDGTRFRSASSPTSPRATVRPLFIAKTTRATSVCSTASKGAIWSGRCETAKRPSRKSCPCRRVTRWNGAANTASFSKPNRRCTLSVPLAVVLIFMILFALYGNFKFPVTIALGVIMTEPVGALVALKLTHTPFSVSSVLGTTGLARGFGGDGGHSRLLHQQAAPGRYGHPRRHREASLLRLRPIMMTALVACLGLLACGAFHRHRIGYSKAIRHRHRGRPHLPPLHRILRQSCVVRDGRPRGRCAAGIA